MAPGCSRNINKQFLKPFQILSLKLITEAPENRSVFPKRIYTPGSSNIAMENGPGLKMYFLFKNGDIPASYVRLPEGSLPGFHQFSGTKMLFVSRRVRFPASRVYPAFFIRP